MPNFNMTGEDAVLWTAVGGVMLFVLGIAGWKTTRSGAFYFNDYSRVLMAVGAAAVTWAFFKWKKS